MNMHLRRALVVGFLATICISFNSHALEIIIDGQRGRSTQSIWRSTVFLVIDNEWICTGTLITRNTVLTAAHCLTKNSREIFIGLEKQGKWSAAFYADGFIRHSQYIDPSKNIPAGKVSNDIALVHFPGNLPADFLPARVPNSKFNLPSGSPLIIAGFGDSDGENEIGSGVLRYTFTRLLSVINGFEIDLQSDNQKSNSCSGDSGGPIYTSDTDGKFVLGVSSVVPEKCAEGYSIATYVPAYRKWIEAGLKVLEPETKLP